MRARTAPIRRYVQYHTYRRVLVIGTSALPWTARQYSYRNRIYPVPPSAT
jgi:hypothetical protein